MLAQRIVTAIMLLAVLGAAMAVSTPWPFMLLLALGMGCAAWEWARLTLPVAHSVVLSRLMGGLLALLVLVLAWEWCVNAQTPVAQYSRALMVYGVVPLSAFLWLFAASVAVLRGRIEVPAAHWGWTGFAPLALLATWTVLTLFFMKYGAVFVLSLLALVWVADSAAYFAGRTWGRRKLAAHVSPGKTVEGALAGMLAAVIWIAVSSRWQGTFGDLLAVRWSLWGALFMAAGLAGLAILGDLFESLLKRRAGYKNSSALLPGHGGVYDRIDAILPVAPWAFILSGAVC